MKSVSWCLVLPMVVGLIATPAWAAELRLTGFIENVFPRFNSNISQGDKDVTRLQDQSTFGRTRGRMYFNVIANDDLRGVFGFELDAVYGRNPDGAAFSFDRNTDMAGNIETKWMYVDYRIPQLPIGNRMRLGGFPLYVTPLHGQTVLHGDVGGGDWLLNFTDQVALHVYYAQFEEDSAADADRFPGMPVANQFGEDYATGMTLRLKPIEGLDLHIPFVYGHLQIPSNTMTSQSGPSMESPLYFTNVTTESRYYVGLDSRYRWGNLSIEPTFMYLFGTRGDSLDKSCIAVLPFISLSAGEDRGHVADSLTEELIAELSQIPGLTVIPRTLVMKYKETREGVATIGRELQVGTILEGSVRSAGNQLRINAQLIDVVSEGYVWSREYDRELTGVFGIESDIATQVAQQVRVQLAARREQQIGEKSMDNPDGYSFPTLCSEGQLGSE